MTTVTSSLISLPAKHRRVLTGWLRSTTLRQGLSIRARILLDLHEGYSPSQVANAHRVSRKTVYKWIHRYQKHSLEGLEDQPRSGRPSVIDKKTFEQVLKLTTERVPHESTHWSITLMAKYAGITRWQVRKIWAAADLKPHRLKTFKISNDPKFAEKVTDIVGLYMNPPSNALVLSVDEKTQIQALDRTQPGLPLSPGHVGSRTHDYKRNGTASLYAAFNILTGEVTGTVRPSQNAQEFLKFLNTIKRKAPPGQDIHIILDNLSAHKTPAIKAWMEKNSHIHFHFTPTSASWLNAVEGWFAQLERRSLYRGVFTSVAELKDEINRFIKVYNSELAKPFQWTKDAKTIIKAVDRAKKVLPN